MKNLKKLFVLALALVMCLSAVSINSFAADFDTEVYVYTRYIDANQLYVSVVTEKACGGMKATLTYPAAKLTFDSTNSKLVESSDIEGLYNSDATAGTITFAVVTKDTTKGDTYWADLCFTVVDSNNIALVLGDIQVCDIDENLDNAVSVPSKIVNADAVINGLGAQYRAEADNVTSALRFGTKITRKKEYDSNNALRSVITIDETEYYAVQCGHFLAYTTNLTNPETELKAPYIENGELKWDSSLVHSKSTTNYTTEDGYIIYTVAVKFVDNEAGTVAEKQAKKISAVPYVIYRSKTGTDYQIRYGEVLENSYNNVKNIYDFATGTTSAN